MPRLASPDRHGATRPDPMVDDVNRFRARPVITGYHAAAARAKPRRLDDGAAGLFSTGRHAGERAPQGITGTRLCLEGQDAGDEQQRAGKGTRQTEGRHGTPRISTGMDALAKRQRRTTGGA